MTVDLYQALAVVGASGALNFIAGIGVRASKEEVQYRRDVQDGKVEKACPYCQKYLYERR